MMPQTLLAFIGASGRSVKIVCRGEIFGGGLPTEEEDIKRFHLNLYEKARMVYNAWSMNTTSRRPTIDENGQATKPFLLPQENPLKYYDETLYSFNTPDFTKTKVSFEKSAAYREIASDIRTKTKVKTHVIKP